MRIRYSVFLLCMVLPGPPMGPPTQEVTVAGTVVERGTLFSIGGATVSLSGKPAFFTGLDGRFRFTEVVPGSATLTISALGYHPLTLELSIRGDTTLTIEMDPDPIRMDSLLVRPGKISIRGTVRDGVSGLRVPRANLYTGSGQQTTANHLGTFRFKDVPKGRSTLFVEAATYAPARIALVADSDTTLSINLEPDPVGTKLLENEVRRLEVRSRRTAYSRTILDRNTFVQAPGRNLYDLLRTRLGKPFGALRPECLIIDEVREYDPNHLQSFRTADIERVEIFKRGVIIRVYTRDFVVGMIGRNRTLLPIVFIPGTNHPICF